MPIAASIQILFEAVATPHRVAGLDDVKVLRIAAGHNHCLAYDDQGSAYSWGNGGYGRLGHKVGAAEAWRDGGGGQAAEGLLSCEHL